MTVLPYIFLFLLATSATWGLAVWVRRPGLPPHRPILETVLTAIGWVLLFAAFGWTLLFVRYALALLILGVAAEVDRRHHLIPDRLMGLGLVFGGSLLLAQPADVVAYVGAAGVAGGGLGLLFLGSLWLLHRPGLGLGDVKLAVVLGFLIGWPVLWVIYLAAVVGTLVGLLGVASGRCTRYTRLPFAPFILVGAVLGSTVLPVTMIWPI